MNSPTKDARIGGIEKKMCFLESQIRKESKRNTRFFLLGLVSGLLMNILFLLRF